MAKSFFSKLRTERLDHVTFLTRRDATAAVNDYVEHFNHHRLHQSLDYDTPAERLSKSAA